MSIYSGITDLLSDKTLLDYTQINISETPVERKHYLYIIKDELNRVKIGITKDIKKRLIQLERSTGLKILSYTVFISDTSLYPIEQKVLEEFENYRINGTEWLKGVTQGDLVDTCTAFLTEVK